MEKKIIPLLHLKIDFNLSNKNKIVNNNLFNKKGGREPFRILSPLYMLREADFFSCCSSGFLYINENDSRRHRPPRWD